MNKRNKHTSQRRVAVYSVNAATERKKKKEEKENKKKTTRLYGGADNATQRVLAFRFWRLLK